MQNAFRPLIHSLIHSYTIFIKRAWCIERSTTPQTAMQFKSQSFILSTTHCGVYFGRTWELNLDCLRLNVLLRVYRRSYQRSNHCLFINAGLIEQTEQTEQMGTITLIHIYIQHTMIEKHRPVKCCGKVETTKSNH